MGRKEKLLEKLNRIESKRDFTFTELETLLIQAGWKLTRSKGSHHIYTSSAGQVVNLKKKPGKIKCAYVEDVRNALKPE
jgi:predicted RNA binding protein YcfA (HicA-like mRNA interferase family)